MKKNCLLFKCIRGGVLLICSLFLASCENFLNGAEIKDEIEAQIAYANSPAYKIRVDYPESRGVIKSPAGGETYKKVSDVFNVSFEPVSDWEFVCWKIVNSATKEEIPNGTYLTLSSLENHDTECTFTNAPENGVQICLEPVLAERPQIISYSPLTSGVLKDSTILVLFDRKMDPASIYYTEAEMDRLRKDGVADENFLPPFDGTERNHYGYKKDGETFFKNISIKNKKTERSINHCFAEPVFVNESTLSISVREKEAVADYTQILVSIEKDFFYTVGEKYIKMAGSKKWMYQVTDETDSLPLVIATNADSTDKISVKIGDVEIPKEVSHEIASDGDGLDTLNFFTGDEKIRLNLEVEERDSTGSGPNDFFNLHVKKILDADYNPCAAEMQDVTVYYQKVLGVSAKYEGEVDFASEGISIDDGVYEMWLEFWDKSGNSTSYPNGKKYYFAKDECGISSLPEPVVSGGGENGKYTLGWNVPSARDYNGAVVSYGIKGSDPISTETISKEIGNAALSLDYSDTLYEISVAYIDYKGHIGDASKFSLRGNALTQEPVKLTDYVGTCGGGSYYKFGDFPQTISGISSYSSSPVCNGWYLGGDGYFYEKCTANPYTESGSNYTCSDGTKLVSGETYYFRVEPIRWRKLTDSYDGKSLLFAEDELTAGIPYYLNGSNRTIGSSTVYPNNYKYSTLRAYLNGKYEDGDPQKRTYSGNGFLQKAFTSSAQNLIADTEVDNSARGTNPDTNMIWNNGNNQYACANTTDKIFLLSQQELTKSDYGFQVYNSPSLSDYSSGANSRTRFTTDYAKANYALQDVRNGIGGWWWMRSPRFAASTEARIVIRNGCADNNYRCVYNSNEGGIVPALCVSTLPEN